MASHLGISPEKFYRDYARELNGAWALQERQSKHGFDCVLLDRDAESGKALCAVYEDRPKQCSTWPFWWVNTRSKQDWKAAKSSTPCPGMDEGELISLEAIREKLGS
jgi:Fe-S-cluster containining protein